MHTSTHTHTRTNRSGRLVFSEEEFNSDTEQDDTSPTNSATHLQVAMITEEETDVRVRSSSAGSEQIGRFEVSQDLS